MKIYLGSLKTGRIRDIHEISADVFWIENGELYLKRIDKQDLVICENKKTLRNLFTKNYFIHLILFLIFFVFLCNGIMHFYYQLELSYMECLEEKENWFSKTFFKKNCQSRVSLFNVGKNYLH